MSTRSSEGTIQQTHLPLYTPRMGAGLLELFEEWVISMSKSHDSFVCYGFEKSVMSLSIDMLQKAD
jgi:hypothetical protein